MLLVHGPHRGKQQSSAGRGGGSGVREARASLAATSTCGVSAIIISLALQMEPQSREGGKWAGTPKPHRTARAKPYRQCVSHLGETLSPELLEALFASSSSLTTPPFFFFDNSFISCNSQTTPPI